MPVITADSGSEIEAAPVAADFLSPPCVPHYENGPITTHMVECEGRLWAVTYHAERDKVGWRVRTVTIEPAEDEAQSLREGDLVEIRCKVIQDMGTDLQLRVEAPDYRQSFWIRRNAITRIHRPAP